ncbi:cytochrome c oxidase subunit [Micractinium conductrix]|uniref:Cytochrome c oxidase subunit n=1 Tax=Micractinium conductrix TaxID=554055 RepID=A0A2P6VCA1_9CHLO|nr:cytochrome c oxidase subunit [Micractinium conductrix]|eukprot:PSC71716.1 cytochrome c oxidase subunit [Micractinium conductrix]
MQAQQHEGGLAKKAEEAAFQLHRTTCLQEEHLMWRAAAAAKWAALWGAALASGQEDGALCAFSLACALAALLLAIQEQLGPGLFYTLELAIDVLQPVSACSLLHRLYPPAAGTGPLRSLAAVLLGNGVLALALRAKTSPLPVRWQLPGLLATAATLLAHTRTFCGNSLLQHGYATLHTLLRLLLPLASPALVSLAPPLTRAPEASAGGAALCAAYHVPSVMLGCAALAAHLYAAEAQQRKAFLAARRDRRRSSGSGSSAELQEEQNKPALTESEAAVNAGADIELGESRRCYVAYNEYHKCIKERGEGSGDCRPYMRAYRSICPDEWIEKWKELRETGGWYGKY